MLEQFFSVMDEPKNWPVAVHCSGGRHRTGTLGALFRLEYDRWPAEKALAEMYSFQFGLPLSVHEHNLRTYLPRPHPSPETWQQLQAAWQPQLKSGAGELRDYEQLVHALRLAKFEPGVRDALQKYLSSDQPFAICLAQRVIDTPAEPLASLAAEKASACLAKTAADPNEWAMAAALVADFGTPEQQGRLVELLQQEPHDASPSPRYHAVVLGVTNRYTRNRIAFLRPLLDDTRQRLDPDAARYRYCDTAMARLSVIINKNLMEQGGPPDGMTQWQFACRLAQDWLSEHEDQTQLSQLVPPDGNNELMIGEMPRGEDLSRMRK